MAQQLNIIKSTLQITWSGKLGELFPNMWWITDEIDHCCYSILFWKTATHKITYVKATSRSTEGHDYWWQLFWLVSSCFHIHYTILNWISPFLHVCACFCMYVDTSVCLCDHGDLRSVLGTILHHPPTLWTEVQSLSQIQTSPVRLVLQVSLVCLWSLKP